MSHTVTVELTDEEYEALSARAETTGVSLAYFLKGSALVTALAMQSEPDDET